MIVANNISFGYTTANSVFDGANFIVGKGQKVGLVGPNGAGKSTLFKLLVGQEPLSGGKIETIGKIEYVPQEVKRDDRLEKNKSVREYLDPENKHQDFEIKRMMDGLELSHVGLYSVPQNLSGGQKTKLALIRALLAEPDTLLLDEPTNFLDIAGKRWVTDFLGKYPKTVLVVSHDLKLLDSNIQKVLEIVPHKRKIETYKGNYSKYLALKKEKEELLERQVTAEEKHIRRMEESVKKLYKHSSGKGVRQRVMLQRRVERAKAALPQLPPEVRGIKIKPTIPAWVGELPIRAINISKSFGDKLILEKVSLSIKRGERVALIGANGAGKSTFLKILVGVLEPDLGQVIKQEATNVGYYSQEFEAFDLEKTLFETITDATHQPEGKVRSMLARFLFNQDKIFLKVGTLSGGEKTRLYMCLLLLKDHNVLILDEPTTYLDPLSQRVILEVLKEYGGAMIIVSHVPEFVQELLPTRALLLPENKVEFWSEDLLYQVSEV